MRTVFVVSLAVALALALAVLLLIPAGLGLRAIDRALAPAGPATDRVDLLADGIDAIILSPFVTGDRHRLLGPAELDRHRAALWYTRNTDAGNLLGAGLLAAAGMAPFTDIATTFRAGRPVRLHSCLTVGCRTWPAASGMWGLSPLRGLGAALGPAVTPGVLTFDDHAAYRAAHAAVVRDPHRWLALPRDADPLPGDDGRRLVVVTLPTRLSRADPGGDLPGDDVPRADPALAQDLAALAQRLVEGLDEDLQGGPGGVEDGAVSQILGAVPHPLWVLHEGGDLRSPDGRRRALPDLVAHDPTLRLRLPVDAVPALRARLAAERLAAPDLAAVDAALARAFVGWGLETGCLPACAAVVETPAGWVTAPEVWITPAPSWTLRVWDLADPPD